MTPTAPQPSDYDKYRTEMSTSPLAGIQKLQEEIKAQVEKDTEINKHITAPQPDACSYGYKGCTVQHPPMNLSIPAPQDSGEPTLEENFGDWLEHHGVTIDIGKFDGSQFAALIDLNVLKGALLEWKQATPDSESHSRAKKGASRTQAQGSGDGVEAILNPQVIDDLELPEWWVAKTKAAIELLLLEERILERTKERQELLKAYRMTAHNSGFGRQLSENLKRNANRLVELQSNLPRNGEA